MKEILTGQANQTMKNHQEIHLAHLFPWSVISINQNIKNRTKADC